MQSRTHALFINPLANGSGTKKKKLRRKLLACISPARAAALKLAEGASQAESYPVPYTLAVSTVDKLTLELDFMAADIAGGMDSATAFARASHACRALGPVDPLLASER